ncbi:hypothetical protein ACEPAH_3390 [Sanghuangporus vaninii]
MFSDYNSLFTTAAGLSFPVSRLSNYNHARAPPLVMGPEEMKVRQRLRTQCLPTRAPSPVGFSKDAVSDRLKESVYPFTFTYPPSLAHAILVEEDDLKFGYEEELPLVVDSIPRFVSPRDISPPSFSNEGTEQSAFSSPPTESATDTPDTDCGDEITAHNCSDWESDDENDDFCEEQWEQENETSSEASYRGQKRRRPDEDQEDEEFREFEENSDDSNDDDDDEEQEEENAEAVFADQKRWRPVCKSRVSIQIESDNSIRNLVGKDTPLKTTNGRYICRWGIVVGGGCSVCTIRKRNLALDDLTAQTPLKRHIVAKHLAKDQKQSWSQHMVVRKRPWWWPSPLFVTGSFNLREGKLQKRPNGETRSWLEYIGDVVRRTSCERARRRAVSVGGHEDNPEPGPSRRRSKRARRS